MTRARDLAAFVSNADGDIKFDTDTLFIDSSTNRVGIGTTTPDTPLHIEDGDVTVGNSTATGDNKLIFKNTSATLAEIRAADTATGAGALLFTNNGSERMRIDSSGNVGIGTSSPSQLLHLYKSSGTSRGLVETGGSTDASQAGFQITTPSRNWQILAKGSDNDLQIYDGTAATERMRIDSSGNLLVGVASAQTQGGTTAGTSLYGGSNAGLITAGRNGDVLRLNRHTTDGTIAEFRKDGTTVGSIGNIGSTIVFRNVNEDGISLLTDDGQAKLVSTNSSGLADNDGDIGAASYRWDDIYATNGTIQTSDEREKQQIASLTDAEITAAKAISKLFKTFKWNDSVAEKGDAARTHTGVIAQQVETAMSDAGLDAGNYAFFISTTWWETQTEVPAVEAVEAQDAVYEDVIIPAVEEVLDEEGNVVTEAQPERTEQRLVSEAVEAVEGKEAYTRTDTYDTLEEAPEGATERNRKGIRYPELLSFIGAATEQRLTSIEARLDALEA